MLLVLLGEKRRIQCAVLPCGLARQRTLGVCTDPARKHQAGASVLPINLAQSVFNLDQGSTRREHVGLVAPAFAEGDGGSLLLQAGFFQLLQQQRAHGLRVVALQPGQGGVPLNAYQGQLPLRLCALGIALKAFGFELALV